MVVAKGAGTIAALAAEPGKCVASLLLLHATQHLVDMALVAPPHQLPAAAPLCSLRIGVERPVDLATIHGAVVGGWRRDEGCSDERGEEGHDIVSSRPLNSVHQTDVPALISPWERCDIIVVEAMARCGDFVCIDVAV